MNTARENESIVKMSNILKNMSSFIYLTNKNILTKTITEKLGGEITFTYKADGLRVIYKLNIDDETKVMPYFESLYSEFGCAPDIFSTTSISPELFFDPGYDFVNDLNPTTIARIIMLVCKEIDEYGSEWNLWVQYLYDVMKKHHEIISNMVKNNETVINSMTENNNPDLF